MGNFYKYAESPNRRGPSIMQVMGGLEKFVELATRGYEKLRPEKPPTSIDLPHEIIARSTPSERRGLLGSRVVGIAASAVAPKPATLASKPAIRHI